MHQLIFTVTNDLNYDQRMIRICSTMAAAGYQVTLVGRKKKASLDLVDRPFKQQRLSCFFEKGKLFYAEYNLRLFVYLLFAKYDAICGIDLDTLLPAYLSSRLKGKPCIYDAHEYFTELPEVINRPATKKTWSRIANSIIPRLQYCYTVCQSLADIFKKEYGPHFEVIRNVPFAEKQLTKKEKKKGPKILLYQGALNDGRGISELLSAMQNISNAELWLAGEGDLSDALRSKTKELNLEKKVKFLGYVLPDQLKAITLEADIGLNLLENKGLNYYYSLANKAFDYVQAEIPAINMDFPEYKNLNAAYKCSILIPDLKVETISKSLNELIQNAALYDRLVSNCKQAKRDWCWEVEEQRLIRFYATVFGNI